MTTRYLQLPHHHTTGVTLTDTALRFVSLTQHSSGVLPERFAEVAVPEGCLDNGKIIDKTRFVTFLKSTRKLHKLDTIRLVLDSPQIQTLSLSVKGAAPLYIKEAVEKEFGLQAKDIIYEYKAVAGNDSVTVVQVTAISKIIAQDFISAFKSAGFTIVKIESVGSALSRDLLSVEQPQQNALIINIDTAVTSMTFIVNGRVAQTMHFAFGDDIITKAITDKLSVSFDEAQRLKQDQGLTIGASRTVFDTVVNDCVSVVRHINETYIAWRTAHPAVPALETVYLTGIGSTLRGLDDYIGVGLRVPVQQGNVWTNCFSFDEHIPAIPQQEAVKYGPAIGVSLVSPHTVNLLPFGHQQSLRRRHAMKVSGKIFFSFVFGVAVGFGVARAIAIPTVHTKIVDVLHKIQARW